ncbi:30S ribosomal protein S2 [Enterobacteriaceae bacterium ET-AT1-13]|nr:30S ribosomal protein S2 [Enterobacteriaceae bacterium ET-AT1-13]WMC17747.1 MAG: 30S ribosomal protein S2 [Enterobacteriaceae bacterium PSmelAO3-2]WMC17951.1 MAG: 30S ribosomal protein S2 [Enterobacteriaceae bacterium PSmelAO3-1]WMC18153.1 MAG: 30S ribosomal protein S2 [Enterobacteriaceae bacterium PSmelAO1]
MFKISIYDMVKSGVHFGHQTRYWNPKMKKFIFGIKNKIHIINLEKTLLMINKAMNELIKITSYNGKILFIGTKFIAYKAIKVYAENCNQFYVNHRWLGGMLTNWKTVKNSILKLNNLEIQLQNGILDKLTKKESLLYKNKLIKLKKSLDGIKNMENLPDAIFVIDSNYEKIAIKEANQLGIKVFSIVDTNSDPRGIDYIIPGNDDSIYAIKFYLNNITLAINEGIAIYRSFHLNM